MIVGSLKDYVDREIHDILQKCTGCGICAQVCPILPYTLAKGEDPKRVVAGVLDILRGQGGNSASARWVESCAGSGVCVKECPEPVNPRRMLLFAKSAIKGGKVAMDRRQIARERFKKTGKTVRFISGMQVDPEDMKRITGRQDTRKKNASALFWIGCNLPRTAHLVLTVEDILERLNVDVEVLGGLDNCCGIVHFREGDDETGEKIVRNTVRNMEKLGPDLVITWCPTCHIQFSELLGAFLKADFRFQHLTRFLVDHLDILTAQGLRRIEKRIALHDHRGLDGVAENIRKLVSAIPGIAIVEVPQLGNHGYMCSKLGSLPEAKEAVQRQILEAADRAGADIVVTPYHSCQRELCIAERDYPFEVKNFVTLLGEALGIEYEDKYKKFRILGDADKIIDEAAPFIKMNKLSQEEARQIARKEIL